MKSYSSRIAKLERANKPDEITIIVRYVDVSGVEYKRTGDMIANEPDDAQRIVVSRATIEKRQ